jgi:hypothetical protein
MHNSSAWVIEWEQPFEFSANRGVVIAVLCNY